MVNLNHMRTRAGHFYSHPLGTLTANQSIRQSYHTMVQLDPSALHYSMMNGQPPLVTNASNQGKIAIDFQQEMSLEPDLVRAFKRFDAAVIELRSQQALLSAAAASSAPAAPAPAAATASSKQNYVSHQAPRDGRTFYSQSIACQFMYNDASQVRGLSTIGQQLPNGKEGVEQIIHFLQMAADIKAQEMLRSLVGCCFFNISLFSTDFFQKLFFGQQHQLHIHSNMGRFIAQQKVEFSEPNLFMRNLQPKFSSSQFSISKRLLSDQSQISLNSVADELDVDDRVRCLCFPYPNKFHVFCAHFFGCSARFDRVSRRAETDIQRSAESSVVEDLIEGAEQRQQRLEEQKQRNEQLSQVQRESQHFAEQALRKRKLREIQEINTSTSAPSFSGPISDLGQIRFDLVLSFAESSGDVALKQFVLSLLDPDLRNQALERYKAQVDLLIELNAQLVAQAR